MKGFGLFKYGAFLFFIIGLVFSLIQQKAQFLIWLVHYRIPYADYYFYYATRLAEPVGFMACAIFLWFYSWKKMITVPFAGAIVLVVSFSLKLLFHHERPSLYLSRIAYDGPLAVLTYPMLSGNNGFPSGHSMAAWALYTLVAAHTKKTWMSALCLMCALSVSISRVYLMAHFLEDVVFGGAVGVLIGYGVYYVYVSRIKARARQKEVVGPGIP
ncbi:MAG: phosphatase PAP2 family protein [Saprospiraceae bacterium]